MVSVLAALALAHGPPPAVVGVGAADAAGPNLLPLTEGLAARDGEGWRFVCPARWGSSPESPYVIQGASGAWVPGLDDLYQLDAGGRATAAGFPELAASEILDYALDDAGAVVLRRPEAGGSEVWALDPPRRIAALALPYDSIAVGGDEVVLAYVEAGAFGVTRVGRSDGVVRADDVVDPGPVTWTPAVRVAGGVTYIIERGPGTTVLDRLDGTTLVPLLSSIVDMHGPVWTADGALAALDGRLTWIDGDTLTPTGEGAVISCLGARDGVAWACADTALVEVRGGVLSGAPLAPIAALSPEGFVDVAPEACGDCLAEWVRIAADLGEDDPLDGLAACPAPQGDTGAGDSGSEKRCGCAIESKGAALGWLFAAVVIARRKRAHLCSPLLTWPHSS
jgi:hypothetical protein